MAARLDRASPLFWAGAILVIAPALAFPAAATRAQNGSDATVSLLAARVGSSLGPPGGEVRSLVIAPSDPARMYLGTATGHLYASHDGGGRWQALPLRLGHEVVIDNILVHPGNRDVVWAAFWEPGGTGGLVHTVDGGASWSPVALGGTPSLRAVAMAPSDARRLYVGGIGGVWRSDDSGASWYNTNGKGLATDFIESLAVDPRDPDTVYAGTWRQVYRTRDGGATWSRIYQGMALDRDVFALAIDPRDPDRVLAGTCNFLYCSTNAGGSWGERRDGLATAHNRIHAIVYDPDDPQVVYAGTRGALYRSTDAGVTWSVLLSDVAVSALALDPDGGRIFVGTEERGVMVGSAGGGFAESNEGLLSAHVVAFDALPGSPRVLFAARADGPSRTSLYYSTDLGAVWKPLGVTPGIGTVRAIRAQATPVNRVLVVGDQGWWSVGPGGRWATIPAPPGRLAALELAHEAGGQVLAATDAGLFLAQAEALDDQGGAARPFDETTPPVWRPLWTGGPLSALAAAGSDFLAIGESQVIAGPVAGDPASLRARPLDGLDGRVIDVALHPQEHRIAYAVTPRDVYRTDDGGASWERLPLPWPASELRSIAVDPANPDQVLALDYRGSVYRGHGAGRHWLVLDDDPGLYRAWALRMSAQAPGYALVATQGHGLRVVGLHPLATPPTGAHD